MAGYAHHLGMSNNAADAYIDGRKPLSKITATDLRNHGIDMTLKRFRELVQADIITTSEWHHSGGTWYNKVKFYDLEEIAQLIADDPEHFEQAAPQPVAEPERRVKGTYNVFGGSRRRPRLIGTENFTGVLRGAWIHLDGGGKKRADGNHITWRNA